jgi:GAF domain-containing protein
MNTQTEADRLIQRFSKEMGNTDEEIRGFATIVDRLAEQLIFLSDAGKILSASLDLRVTFDNLVNLIVPFLADWCTISLVKANGEIDRIASTHADKEKEKIVKQLEHRFPPNKDAPIGVPLVVRTKKSEFVESFDLDSRTKFKSYRKEMDIPDLLFDMGVCSYMTIPMILKKDRRVIGAIWYALSDSGRHFTRDDLSLAQDLTAIATQSVYNSMLYGKVLNRSDRLEFEKGIRENYIYRQIENIKTPLTAAILMIQVLPKLVKFSEKEEFLVKKATESIQKAVQMIEDLASQNTTRFGSQQDVLDPRDEEQVDSVA